MLAALLQWAGPRLRRSAEERRRAVTCRWWDCRLLEAGHCRRRPGPDLTNISTLFIVTLASGPPTQSLQEMARRYSVKHFYYDVIIMVDNNQASWIFIPLAFYSTPNPSKHPGVSKSTIYVIGWLVNGKWTEIHIPLAVNWSIFLYLLSNIRIKWTRNYVRESAICNLYICDLKTNKLMAQLFLLQDLYLI